MKSQNVQELSDQDLIKAHLQAAKCGDPEDAIPGINLGGGLNAARDLGSTQAGRAMLAADSARRARLAAAGLSLWLNSEYHDAGKVTSALLRANQKDWTGAQLIKVLEIAAQLRRGTEHFTGFNAFPYKPLISTIEKAAEREPISADFRAALESWKEALMPRPLTPKEEREFGEAERMANMDVETTPWAKISEGFATVERLQRIRVPLTEERKLIERLARVLSAAENPQKDHAEPTVRIDTTDAVGIKMAADVASGSRAAGKEWARLLNHARTLSSTVPSQKWLEQAAACAKGVRPNTFQDCLSEWFNEAGKAAPEKIVSYREVSDATLFSACTVELLKGLVWTVVAAQQIRLAHAMGNLAEASYKKIRNIGPRNVKIGNAAVATLAALEKPEAATQLSRLRLRVKHPSSRATIDKALAALSKKTGISPEDLSEMAVPNFGLDAKGSRHCRIGKFSCEFRVIDSQKVGLVWDPSDAKKPGELPPGIRKQHGEELKRLQREVKDASTMLAAQTLRLERSFLNDRNWPFQVWQERFLNHPLMGTLARRLIWKFTDTLAIPCGGKFVSSTDRVVSPGSNTVVSLWHPISSDVDVITGWRTWLDRHEVTQPFKQAHREIYVLTDAERRTKSYSNRFAAHILRQHQFAALCAQRGWNFHVQGDFDSHNNPTLPIPAHNLAAEFWVEALPAEMTQPGIFLYLTSDQVRFGLVRVEGGARQSVRAALTDVPPIVFSEVMRDVDLFVGVTSVMNDPTWRDGAPGGRCQDYWNQWSFGDLSENAKSRRAALERLLPRLANARLFSLKDKFLVVKGSLRTYKIHLGSGNILMEPNDQYLCIVPAHGAASRRVPQRVFLPFEGDSTLSLILSKALMLAEDAKIKDETITRQINS